MINVLHYHIVQWVVVLGLTASVFAALLAAWDIAFPRMYRYWMTHQAPIVGAIEWIGDPNAAPVDHGFRVVSFRLKKNRACQWQSMAVYTRDPGGDLVRVNWGRLEGPNGHSDDTDYSRMPGWHKFTLRLGTAQKVENLEIVATHKCGPKLPAVQSVIWPPECPDDNGRSVFARPC